MASLSPYGCSNLSTVRLVWDNRERFTGFIRAPAEHRKDAAAGNTFRILREKCVALRTLHVQLSLEMSSLAKPNGQRRDVPLRSYRDIEGMDELKALVQTVRAREGGGNVTIALAPDYLRRHGFWTVNVVSLEKKRNKEALKEWLEDGKPVELAVAEEAEDEMEVDNTVNKVPGDGVWTQNGGVPLNQGLLQPQTAADNESDESDDEDITWTPQCSPPATLSRMRFRACRPWT